MHFFAATDLATGARACLPEAHCSQSSAETNDDARARRADEERGRGGERLPVGGTRRRTSNARRLAFARGGSPPSRLERMDATTAVPPPRTTQEHCNTTAAGAGVAGRTIAVPRAVPSPTPLRAVDTCGIGRSTNNDRRCERARFFVCACASLQGAASRRRSSKGAAGRLRGRLFDRASMHGARRTRTSTPARAAQHPAVSGDWVVWLRPQKQLTEPCFYSPPRRSMNE
jgi:hypothetical protein